MIPIYLFFFNNINEYLIQMTYKQKERRNRILNAQNKKDKRLFKYLKRIYCKQNQTIYKSWEINIPVNISRKITIRRFKKYILYAESKEGPYILDKIL